MPRKRPAWAREPDARMLRMRFRDLHLGRPTRAPLRRAIRRLVSEAEEGDTILILGKGHEQGQEAGGVVTPFDDRVELAEAIREREVSR